MTKALTNYDKIKISTAHVFLQYNPVSYTHLTLPTKLEV